MNKNQEKIAGQLGPTDNPISPKKSLCNIYTKYVHNFRKRNLKITNLHADHRYPSGQQKFRYD